MSDLKEDLKKIIISSLNLEDLKISDIDDNMVLFSDEGLGLDSVDALELGLAIQKEYNIEMDTKNTDLKEVFLNINSLANYIKQQKENS